MLQARVRTGLMEIGQALREPESFTLRWHYRSPYHWTVFLALAMTAITGTTFYGMIMGLPGGAREMMLDRLRCTLAAGIAWTLPLPALYIWNSRTGSRLRASTTLLAAQVTTSWGGLAMIAAIPVAWFFTVALPYPSVILLVHLAVFTVVGVAMIDVFCRMVETLEPRRGRQPAWVLALVGAIGGELFYAFGLFKFTALSGLLAGRLPY
jgi:hypothetical protein